MGNLLFTMFGILSPMASFIFMISAVIGFFGVYIPWNERKKKTGIQKKGPRSADRAKALARMIGCIPVFVIGMTMLIASAVIGIPVLIALGGALTIVSLLGMERAGKDFRAAKLPRPSKSPKPAFRRISPDHEHIAPLSQGTKARLEQLDTLKRAGLISDQEYQQKRREAFNESGM